MPLADSEPGIWDRLRQSGLLDIPPIRKIFEEPLMPVAGTAVDIFPMVLMFALLAVGTVCTLKLQNRQLARRIVQTFSAFAFVLSVHPCMCMLRDVTLGTTKISTNTLEAFKYIMIFAVVAAFGLVFGRIFCGWVCPLGFFQEISTKYFNWTRSNKSAGLAVLCAVSLMAAGLVVLRFIGI
ncbi:MAG: 4Fe-4S binding protein, partial [Planctomycetota bacterium]|nr:4Fe-4S binding protein [Planctomycetota bacterium]